MWTEEIQVRSGHGGSTLVSTQWKGRCLEEERRGEERRGEGGDQRHMLFHAPALGVWYW